MTTEEHFKALEETDRRIQERHQALAETVEIIAGMQRENDRQIGQLTTKLDTLTTKVDVLAERTIQAMDAINRLGNIMISHEERLEKLDGQ